MSKGIFSLFWKSCTSRMRMWDDTRNIYSSKQISILLWETGKGAYPVTILHQCMKFHLDTTMQKEVMVERQPLPKFFVPRHPMLTIFVSYPQLRPNFDLSFLMNTALLNWIFKNWTAQQQKLFQWIIFLTLYKHLKYALAYLLLVFRQLNPRTD